MYFFEKDAANTRELFEGIRSQVFYGERIMMAFVDLDAGAIVPEHRHEHEQMGHVLSGELQFEIGDDTKICRAGDSYLIPSNVPHRVTVLHDNPAKVLDIFSPPREEYK